MEFPFIRRGRYTARFDQRGIPMMKQQSIMLFLILFEMITYPASAYPQIHPSPIDSSKACETSISPHGFDRPLQYSHQQSQILLNFHRAEQQNWKELITNIGMYSDVSSFDITFYHLQLDIRVSSPYLMGSVYCR